MKKSQLTEESIVFALKLAARGIRIDFSCLGTPTDNAMMGVLQRQASPGVPERKRVYVAG